MLENLAGAADRLQNCHFSSASLDLAGDCEDGTIRLWQTSGESWKIGSAEGWLVRLCDRGPFKVIEFWVENKFPFEFLPPDLAKEYLNFVTIASYEAFMKEMMAAQPA